MTDAAKFWDKMADSYAARAIPDEAAYARTLERAATYLNGDDRVLEVGAGTGTTAIRLAPNVAAYTATDFSGKLMEIARQRAAEAGADNVTFRTADLFDPAEGAPFDAVMAFNLLHLVEDLDGAVAHLASLVKPGGYLISKSACLGGQITWMRPAIWVARKLGRAPFVAFRTIDDLQGAIERHGLKIVETGNYPVRPLNRFVVAQKV